MSDEPETQKPPEPDMTGPDTTVPVETAREEVATTEPARAPLPDPTGPSHAFSPVDLPEPDQPLQRPLAWTFTVIATAGLFLALFNAEAIRGWSYELKPTPTSQQVVGAAETWFDVTAAAGLEKPVATMRGWWKDVQAARFGGQDGEGSDAETPEPEQ
jgi:hypothetical protein